MKKFIINFLKYIQSLLRPDSKDSIKSFAMFMSVLCGVFLTICLGVSLILDAAKDGSLNTDLYGAAAETIAIGGMVALSAVPKVLVDKAKIQKLAETINLNSDTTEEDDDNN